MPQPLTPREQSVLHQLGEQIRGEDPGLAQQLERPGRPAVTMLSPVHWSCSAYLVIGLAFLAAGMVLDVGSAVLGGLFSISIAILRSRSARRTLVTMLASRNGDFQSPHDR